MKMKMKIETLVQQELISICRFLEDGFIDSLKPVEELGLIYHIVNEGKRSPQEGAKLKREGLRSGMPDLHLPVESFDGKYLSLYLEMKREDGKGRLSDEQTSVIAKLRKYGNRVEVATTAKQAITYIAEHLGRKDILNLIKSDYESIVNPI
jgi:hypothetical protein